MNKVQFQKVFSTNSHTSSVRFSILSHLAPPWCAECTITLSTRHCAIKEAPFPFNPALEGITPTQTFKSNQALSANQTSSGAATGSSLKSRHAAERVKTYAWVYNPYVGRKSSMGTFLPSADDLTIDFWGPQLQKPKIANPNHQEGLRQRMESMNKLRL